MLCLLTQRSRSAFSLTSDDSPEKPAEGGETAGGPEGAGKVGVKEYASLKKETRAAQMTSWKSVDRLDNSCERCLRACWARWGSTNQITATIIYQLLLFHFSAVFFIV